MFAGEWSWSAHYYWHRLRHVSVRWVNWIRMEFYTSPTIFFDIWNVCSMHYRIQFNEIIGAVFATQITVNWNELFRNQILGNVSLQCSGLFGIAFVYIRSVLLPTWVRTAHCSMSGPQHTSEIPNDARLQTVCLDKITVEYLSTENTAGELASICTSLNCVCVRSSQVDRSLYFCSLILHANVKRRGTRTRTPYNNAHIHTFIIWHRAETISTRKENKYKNFASKNIRHVFEIGARQRHSQHTGNGG